MALLSDRFSWETRRSSSAVPVWMWLCSCGLTDFACCAIPHCLRPEWGGIFALGVTNSPSPSPCQEAPGHLFESLTGISTSRVLSVPHDRMGAQGSNLNNESDVKEQWYPGGSSDSENPQK